ncbi:BTB/POZ domain-containing protein 17-like isoform X3 [Lineus longissimus]|uniref:BTB/POZ domain-containing protein 17-like isoform X3 n=1 Tax=Lineus longissimus TaxID=88925 RepID=UPI00315D226E
MPGHSGADRFWHIWGAVTLLDTWGDSSTKSWVPFPLHVVMDSPSVEILRDDLNFIQNVSQFFNQQSLSDVVLKIGDQRFYGHKFVLAKSSDVFRTMLYERPWSRNITEEVELNESPECQAVFDIFLRYLYTAELAISTDSAVGVLCLADKYNVGSLKDLCVKYMIEHSKSPRVNNALAWYPWSKALHLSELFERCFQCICWNTHEIISSPEWVNMDMEFLSDILLSSQLIVPDEYTLFEAVVTWLQHDNHNQEMTEYSSRLMPLIRFPQMMVGQLYQIEHHELTSQTECGELIRELIGRAYRFRALCPSQTELSVSFSENFFMPRDYSRLSVDNVRMTNTLRFGIQVDVKMYVGPVPNEKRDGDWKITYRKNGDVWSLQIYCHESAMVQNEAKFQATVMVFNEEEKVVQVERPPVYVCSRGNHQNVTLTIDEPELSKTMGVIIKPMAN